MPLWTRKRVESRGQAEAEDALGRAVRARWACEQRRPEVERLADRLRTLRITLPPPDHT